MTSALKRLTASADLVLGEAGYRRLDDYPKRRDDIPISIRRWLPILVYKAQWSTPDVEHFIYFMRDPQRGIVTGSFGMRNADAEAFSLWAIRTYGGACFDHVWLGDPVSCAMRFSPGMLAGTPKRPWQMNVPTMFDADLTTCIHRVVVDGLLPAIEGITTAFEFLRALAGSAELFRWTAVNCAMRAAQIVALAAMTEVPFPRTRAILENRELWIANSAPRTSLIRRDPQAYIEQIHDDWDAWRAKTG